MGIRVHFMHCHMRENVIIFRSPNSPTNGIPAVTCCYHGRPSRATTLTPSNATKGWGGAEAVQAGNIGGVGKYRTGIPGI